jgi:hypothetical protein
MADLKHVMPAGRKPDRWLPASIAIITLVVLIAIAKPWGRGGPPLTAFPSASVATPRASGLAGHGRYDPGLFGQDAPDPAWQLWPAGYVVDFGLAGPVTMTTESSASPAAPSSSPAHGRTPPPSPSPTPSFGGDPIRIGQADNLVVLGINTPEDVDVVQFRLTRYEGTTSVVVPIVVLATPWPVHYFHVIGIESPDASDVLGAWRAGVYRLALIGADGVTIRTVVVSIDAPSTARESPLPS